MLDFAVIVFRGTAVDLTHGQAKKMHSCTTTVMYSELSQGDGFPEVRPAFVVHHKYSRQLKHKHSKKKIYIPRLHLLLGYFFFGVARALPSLLGDFLLGTSSSGELYPSEMQNEPPFDPGLLADFAGLDGWNKGLKGIGVPGGLYMGVNS